MLRPSDHAATQQKQSTHACRGSRYHSTSTLDRTSNSPPIVATSATVTVAMAASSSCARRASAAARAVRPSSRYAAKGTVVNGPPRSTPARIALPRLVRRDDRPGRMPEPVHQLYRVAPRAVGRDVNQSRQRECDRDGDGCKQRTDQAPHASEPMAANGHIRKSRERDQPETHDRRRIGDVDADDPHREPRRHRQQPTASEHGLPYHHHEGDERHEPQIRVPGNRQVAEPVGSIERHDAPEQHEPEAQAVVPLGDRQQEHDDRPVEPDRRRELRRRSTAGELIREPHERVTEREGVPEGTLTRVGPEERTVRPRVTNDDLRDGVVTHRVPGRADQQRPSHSQNDRRADQREPIGVPVPRLRHRIEVPQLPHPRTSPKDPHDGRPCPWKCPPEVVPAPHKEASPVRSWSVRGQGPDKRTSGPRTTASSASDQGRTPPRAAAEGTSGQPNIGQGSA